MPHKRPRYSFSLVKKALAFSPIVGISGQRQVGKTTLINELTSNYISLDNRIHLEQANRDPASFLEAGVNHARLPFAIDECQLAPELFPALKEAVRVRSGAGQFLLTGSVRFTSRRVIRESLTGRIFNLELLPLSLAESHGEALNDLPVRIMKGKKIALPRLTASEVKKHALSMSDFLVAGGLPGICFFRDEFVRNGKFSTHLETLLSRDIHLVSQTNLSFDAHLRLMTEIAKSQGTPISISATARKTRLAINTVKKLLSSYADLFLIRTLPNRGGPSQPLIFLEDQGMATFLTKKKVDLDFEDLVRLQFSCVRHQFLYRKELNATPISFRTRGGAFVPLAFETALGTMGYIPLNRSSADRASLASAKSFLKQFKNSWVVISHMGPDISVEEEGRLLQIPISATL